MREGRQHEGGDPVCWLARVCPECGLFAESPLPATCSRCGAQIPPAEESASDSASPD